MFFLYAAGQPGCEVRPRQLNDPSLVRELERVARILLGPTRMPLLYHLDELILCLCLEKGEGMKFDRFVDPNVRGAKRRVYSDL